MFCASSETKPQPHTEISDPIEYAVLKSEVAQSSSLLFSSLPDDDEKLFTFPNFTFHGMSHICS